MTGTVPDLGIARLDDRRAGLLAGVAAVALLWSYARAGAAGA